MIGAEVPIRYIQVHCSFLCTYEGKGFFLIFVSTFMFASANTYYNDSGRGAMDYLSDACAFALLVKGVFCLLLWLAMKSTEAEDVMVELRERCHECEHEHELELEHELWI